MPRSFLPSRDGFAFDNSWPPQPAIVVPTPFGDVPFGTASGGLCGGMVFAALDYWHAGRTPPEGRPALGTPVYSYIVRRLLDSWRLPGGVARYYEWMGMPDLDSPGFQLFGRPLLTRRGIAYRTINDEWPGIRAELDRGSPVPLGVITVASRQPRDLALNHQVLAYGVPGGHRRTDRPARLRPQPGTAGRHRDLVHRRRRRLHPQPRPRRPSGARVLPHRLPRAPLTARLRSPSPAPGRSPRAPSG